MQPTQVRTERRGISQEREGRGLGSYRWQLLDANQTRVLLHRDHLASQQAMREPVYGPDAV